VADRLAKVTAQTGGPFTRAQAVEAGFTDAQIRRLLRCGDWTVLRRGVYVEARLLASAAGDPERQHALDVAGLLLVLASGRRDSLRCPNPRT